MRPWAVASISFGEMMTGLAVILSVTRIILDLHTLSRKART